MKIQLPNSFEDLTLQQWRLLHTAKDDTACLLALSDKLTPTNITQLPKKALSILFEQLEKLRQQEVSSHVKRIRINGQEYAFVNDWDAFTLGEYIDMETYSKDVTKNCTKIMSLLYRKIKKEEGDNYWLESYTAKEDDTIFESVPASLFGGALVFFSTTRNRLLKDSKLSLVKALKETASLKSGGGILPSISWQERAFLTWTKLRSKVLEQRLRIWRT